MKKVILILSIAISILSCSTAYKTGQTPDDLYAAKPRVEAIKEERKTERRYETVEQITERRQIRMSIYDPRWRRLDYDYDYDWRYNPYAYGYNYGYYYNPCYYPYPVWGSGIQFVNPKLNTVRKANLGGYSNTVVNYTPSKSNTGNRTIVTRRYNTVNSQSTRSSSRSSDNDTRTYSPSTNTNSSGSGRSSNGGSSGGGSSVSRPGRGG
jgi:uncharacterized membrane protein YgcG